MDSDWSHEIKRHSLLGKEGMTNLDSVLRDITLLTKVCIVKAVVFQVAMYRGESQTWLTLKKAERQRIDAFELWCWRRLLRIPWTARRSNQSTQKEFNLSKFGRTYAEAEAPILWPPDVKSWLIGKDPDAWKDWEQEGKVSDRGWDGWITSLTSWTWVWVNSVGWWMTRKPGLAAIHGVGKSQIQISDWTTIRESMRENKTSKSPSTIPERKRNRME